MDIFIKIFQYVIYLLMEKQNMVNLLVYYVEGLLAVHLLEVINVVQEQIIIIALHLLAI